MFFRMSRPPNNTPSGTVVVDMAPLPESYDVFLVSQSVRQGTEDSTSFKDTSGLMPDHLQELT